MSEHTTTQCVLFSGIFERPVVVQFDQPQSSSDGGAILLKAADGADPAKLYEQFRQRNEEREAQQEDVHLQAQEDLTKPITSEDFISVREYRHAREAEGRLLVESGIPLDDMTYSDYKKAREYQQRESARGAIASISRKESRRNEGTTVRKKAQPSRSAL